MAPQSNAEQSNRLLEEVVDLLKNAFNLGRLHHAYLISGPSQADKNTVLQGVKNIFSASPERDPDILHLQGDEQNSIEDVRDFLERFQTTPLGAKQKVGFIESVDAVTLQSQHALLKTLEEPPKHHHLFLTATNTRHVPETILSRCIHIRLPHIAAEDEKENLEAYGFISAENLLAKPSSVFHLKQDVLKDQETVSLFRHQWIAELEEQLKSASAQEKQRISKKMAALLLFNPKNKFNTQLQIENIWIHDNE